MLVHIPSYTIDGILVELAVGGQLEMVYVDERTRGLVQHVNGRSVTYPRDHVSLDRRR